MFSKFKYFYYIDERGPVFNSKRSSFVSLSVCSYHQTRWTISTSLALKVPLYKNLSYVDACKYFYLTPV